MNTSPTRQQGKVLQRVLLKGFRLREVARSDNESEIRPPLSEPLFEKLVGPFPVTPYLRRFPTETRRKFTDFKHKLGEERRFDG